MMQNESTFAMAASISIFYVNSSSGKIATQFAQALSFSRETFIILITIALTCKISSGTDMLAEHRQVLLPISRRNSSLHDITLVYYDKQEGIFHGKYSNLLFNNGGQYLSSPAKQPMDLTSLPPGGVNSLLSSHQMAAVYQAILY